MRAGKYTKIPFIAGTQEDEGTLFGIFTLNITTTSQVANYLSTQFFNSATQQQIEDLVSSYQTTTEDGSPFRTGLLNNFTPQFKRISAIIGDLTFILTRRLFSEIHTQVNPGVPSWSYIATYDYGTPLLGTFHATDLIQVFFGILPNNARKTIRGYYFSFVHNLDPNVGNNFDNWPQWSQGKKLINFGANSNSYTDDTFRSDSYDVVKKNADSFKV